MTYKNLEKNYYKMLLNIANYQNIKDKKIIRAKLPYILEEVTLPTIKANSNWIISAISGSGKTTILKQLTSAGFYKLPNITTRPQRSEENDNDYIFINKETFFSWKNRNLLFHPHKRNGVFHAILKKDLEKFKDKNSLIYLDKSVASSLKLINNLPRNTSFNFVCILPPTFQELYKRILKREHLRKTNKEKFLSKVEIFNRFEEEINDIKKSVKLPYVYIVNDSLDRVKKLLERTILASKQASK